ncbi:DUF4209 domain-containing protein [Neobacillus ginsengisoli]|uniref:DUF4209 domain-containing protein n=1 Tax=Neobacillus ginsengisoli TaxID=904295 RepID=A0ABT9XNF3_9BACI|nr:DUF4209 domain-containing protein [Neobacillus ginsengisoli]MDQ0197077.1 hypothetical protein [Neobacillus ginsengisoli]
MNQRIEEKLKQIEDTDYFEYIFEAGSMFQEVIHLSEEYKEPKVKKMAETEIKLLNINVYTPMIYTNYISRFDKRIIEQCSVSQEEILYFEGRLKESLNIFLKCRYADFLYEYGQGICSINKYQIGTYLVSFMLKTARLHFNHENPINCLEDSARAVFVSLQLKNKVMIDECNNFLFELLLNFEGSNLRWVLELAEIFHNILLSPLKSSLDNDKRQLVLEKLEQARSYYWENKEHHLHRSVCGELIEWAKVNKMNEKITMKYIKEIGASYEEEAEHQQGREEKSEIVKASFLEKALQHYMNYGISEKFDPLKIQIKASYENAVSQGEFKLMSSSVKISQEEIDREIQPYLNVPLDEALLHFAREISFIPNVSQIEENTKKQMKESFSLRNFFGGSVVSDGKKIFQTVDDQDTFKINFNQYYMMAMEIIANVIMVPLFERLVDKGLSATHIINLLKFWGYIDEQSGVFIKIGIEKFFERDYISSMHILVPQLEALVRNFFGSIGYATTVIKKGTVQQEQTFNEFLERKDIKESMPKEVHKYLVMLMVEQTGCNFRNKIAHGLIHPAECNKTNNMLILHFYLLMTNFKLEVDA